MEKWWKKATVYQIYPLSFCDSDNDGYGDIKGIISKLDYLKDLGVKILWLSPVYESPMDDNGYDISDYYKINPLFGTMEDFEELLRSAHERQLKIIMDLVVNHTSDCHPWFLEAKKGKDNKYRNYYIWKDPVNGGVPSDVKSIFSGPAWEYDENTDQYYFHLFSKRQPDLNWDNEELRSEIYKMINWWLDKGIDGFRMDVIDLIGKDIDKGIIANGPTLHKRLQEMYVNCFQGRDIITVGETPCADIEIGKQFTNPKNQELDMIFQFQHISVDQVKGKSKWELAPLNLNELKEIFNTWQVGLYNEGWNSLFWCNHDQPRIVSRFGDDKYYRVESAKMLATALHFMQGTPFVYQGEEIGMTNIKLDISEYKDIETLNMYQEFSGYGWSHEKIMNSIYAKGRDNARTPMQWNDEENAGFTKGNPWLKVNSNYHEINVRKSLNDDDSIYRYYQKLIALRKELDIITYGSFKLIFKDHPQVFAYERKYLSEKLTVVCNFSKDAYDVELRLSDDYEILIGNYKKTEIKEKMKLKPYECFVIRESIINE